MITVFINSFLIILLFTPFGLILSNNKKKDLGYYSTQLIFACIILSFISLLVNFFFPLTQNINTIILGFGIILIFKNLSIYYNKQFLIFLLFSTLLITILILESNVYRPDAGLYHLPYIGILNEEKIILGLSNFHFRYGHISIMQYLSAISNNLLFRENGIVFAQALIAVSVIINFTFKIYNYNKSKQYNFHFYFLISVLLFIFYKMNRYGEYGNDAPAHFIFFYLISELLIINKNKVIDVCNIFLLILFIILNKITLLMCFFFSFFLIKKETITSILKSKRFYFIIFFASIWFIKNILISGCLIYPVKFTCYENLLWTDIKTVKSKSDENESYTKDWPTYKKIINKNNINSISPSEYIKDFFWTKFWIQGHFQKISKILIPYLLVLFLLSLFLFYQKKTKFMINKNNIYIFIFLLFSCLFWFIKVPMFRYGYSYIISFISLIFAFLTCHIYSFKKDLRLFFNIFLIFLFSVLVSKNIIRIVKNENDYNNYPWPKYYAMDEQNIHKGFIKQEINGKIFYKPNHYCMYSNFLCGNYGVKDNLDILYKKNYYIMYLK